METLLGAVRKGWQPQDPSQSWRGQSQDATGHEAPQGCSHTNGPITHPHNCRRPLLSPGCL